MEALQASETLVLVALETAREAGGVGACVSFGAGAGAGAEQAAVATLSCAGCEAFPAASRARTANAYEFAQVSPLTLALGAVGDATRAPSRETS